MNIRRSAREWAGDAGILAGAGLIGGLLILGMRTSDPPESVNATWEILAGTPAYLLLLLCRRRWPATVAAILVPVGFLSVVGVGASSMAMLNVAIRRSWRVTFTIGAAHAALVMFTFQFDADSTREYWETVTVLLSLHATLIVSGMLTRSRRMLIQSLKDRARQAEEEQRLRVEEARHLERERIAREMHDVLAHRISLLAVHAGALEYRAGASPEETKAAGVIRECAYEALEDLRDVIGMLRAGPEPSDAERPQPTMIDVPELIEESRRAGGRIEFDNRIEDLGTVPTRIGRHAYRVVQEGLTNARKHAFDTRVRVAVDTTDEGLSLEISNPMPLVDPNGEGHAMPGAGTGLIGLAERVQLVGGRLDYGQGEADTFRLHAVLPLPPHYPGDA